MFKKKILILVVLLSIFSLSVSVSAQDVAWPQSWFEAPKTASELNINEYNESPYFNDNDREVPAVEERLPKDPIVVEPLNEIGKYGGTAVTFTNDNVSLGDGEILNPVEGLVRPDPEAGNILPSYAKSYEISEDATKLTFHLREGIKWSDGHPFTAEDFTFWWKYEAQNEMLNPTPPEQWTPVGLIDVKAIDDYTVQYVFESSNPLAINKFIMERTLGDNYAWAQPAHHMKNYHEDFLSEEEIEEKIKEHGFDDWGQYYNYGKDIMDPEVGYPVLKAFVVKEKTPNLYIYERNPYYPKVDTEGNQLPYIDEIQVHSVQDSEMMTAKAVSGEATIAGTQTTTTDIPLFKQSEEQGGYKTYLWNRIMGNDLVIQFNLTHEEETKKEIFQDKRFRQAMSLAIDREEINNTIYFGNGTPRQVTVIPSSKYFEEEFAKAYIDHDQEKANQLLDEMRLEDTNDDGIREMPNGEPLNITLEWTPMETPKGPTMELVVSHWRETGIDVDLKQINASLQHERTHSNEMDATLWHGDKMSDLMFPATAPYLVPVGSTWFETSIWREWVDYYVSEGEKGTEPPQEIKEIQSAWETAVSTPDQEKRIEMGKKILSSNAENVWTIGTIGMAPFPIIVNNELKNVPEKGYWGWDVRNSFPYHPETWYLEQ